MGNTRTYPQVFQVLQNYFSRYSREAAATAQRGVLSFPPSTINDVAPELFSALSTGGTCTFVVTGYEAWNPKSPYFEAMRRASASGKSISRHFLLPHRQFRNNESLREHIELDKRAGILTSVLYVGDLLSSAELISSEGLDLGLWDDCVLCTAARYDTYSGYGLSEWKVSCNSEDLHAGRNILALLGTRAQQIQLSTEPSKAIETSEPDLEEPMVASAPAASIISSVMCSGDQVSEDCAWYHSSWQYLRILNLVSTPTWHAKFYAENLAQCAASGTFTRALISGTADYSMLAHLEHAYRRAGSDLSVTVIDLCPTPLFLCKWYAKSRGFRVETETGDVLKYNPTGHYDLITTDAFLTRFPPKFRPEVLSAWHRLLRPGGKVVTTIRAEFGLSEAVIRATPEQVAVFCRSATLEARRWRDFLKVSPEDVAAMASAYAQNIVSYPFASEADVRQLFSANGFQIIAFAYNAVPGEMAATTYVQLVAQRI